MMGAIQRPKGQDLLDTYLWTIRHAKELEKQSTAIEKARNEANALISKVGKAKDIDRLLGEAVANFEASAAAKETAEADAKTILATASASAQATTAATKKDVDKKNARLLDRERTVARTEDVLEAGDKGLDDREAALKDRENKVAESEVAAAGLVATYNAKIADLNEVLAKAGMKQVKT